MLLSRRWTNEKNSRLGGRLTVGVKCLTGMRLTVTVYSVLLRFPPND